MTGKYVSRIEKKAMEAQSERFYHGFVLKLADHYMIISNQESGFGRYGVMMEPKNETDNAIIINMRIDR